MKHGKRLLIAVDDSEASQKAVAYVSVMIDGQPGYDVCLLHALPPAPPFEHGGSEDPLLETILDANLQNKLAEWVEREKESAEPLLEKSKAALRRAQIAEDKVAVRYVLASNVDDLVSKILSTAQKENRDTIVVGRETFTGLDKIFRHHVADDLIRRGEGYTIWVVE